METFSPYETPEIFSVDGITQDLRGTTFTQRYQMINVFRALQRENQMLTQVIRESVDKEREKAPKPAKSTSMRKPAKPTSKRAPARSTSARKPAKSTSMGKRQEKDTEEDLFIHQNFPKVRLPSTEFTPSRTVPSGSAWPTPFDHGMHDRQDKHGKQSQRRRQSLSPLPARPTHVRINDYSFGVSDQTRPFQVLKSQTPVRLRQQMKTPS